MPHVLDTRADGDVVDAGSDEGGGEVDRLLGGAALAVDGGGRRLHRQTGLQPGVAPDVERLLTDLLDAARDDVLDLRSVDPRALDDGGVGLPEKLVRVRVLVVALLGMTAADRRARGLDDDDFATLVEAHFKEASVAALW